MKKQPRKICQNKTRIRFSTCGPKKSFTFVHYVSFFQFTQFYTHGRRKKTEIRKLKTHTHTHAHEKVPKENHSDFECDHANKKPINNTETNKKMKNNKKHLSNN